MNKDNGHAGVLPLVCAVCERAVGVINESALVKHDPDHYAHIVGQAMLTMLLASETRVGGRR